MAPKPKDEGKGKKHQKSGAPSSASSYSGGTRSGAHPRPFSHEEIDAIYNRNQVLGKGGFSTVYGGNIDKVGPVAVKIFKGLSPHTAKQYEIEKTNLLTHQHERLIKMIGYADPTQQHKIPKLVFEKMACNLGKKYEVLCWQEILLVLRQVALGIQFLHSQTEGPFIMTDLKPENILLDEDKNAKICDLFNVSKQDHNINCSTPVYDAPETKAGKATKGSDIYSFGKMIQRLVTKSDEFSDEEKKGHQNEKKAKQTLEEARKNASKVRRSLKDSSCHHEAEASIIDLADKCIQKNYRARPTIEVVIERLTTIIDMRDSSSSSSSKSKSKSSSKSRRRN